MGHYELREYRTAGVSIRPAELHGASAIEIRMPSEAYQDPLKDTLTDRPFLAWLPLDFRNGSIEADVASFLAPDAPAYARGFIGLAFRIGDESRFEAIYLRPLNSRADDQVRRNHSIQYFSLPEHDFARLRRESPEKYESYVDITMGEWIHMRIQVHRSEARLFVNNVREPSLIVTDLKLGSEQHGGVGYWIESGTVGLFRNLQVRHETG